MERNIQFSIFLVNKPGVLSQIFRELARAKVNVEAVAMMDSMEHGVLRFIVDDAGAARPVLKRLNIGVAEAEVLAVTLPNRPGAVADVCERLTAAHINVSYMYCTSGANGGKTNVVLKVPDIKKTMKVLENGKSTRRDMKIKLRRPASTNRR
ncbi:MAG: ACT domain-containing protein [Phycisphaerales bacterium]|nr:ACT domain-containing protein [Phycisphaerales bacterium]